MEDGAEGTHGEDGKVNNRKCVFLFRHTVNLGSKYVNPEGWASGSCCNGPIFS